MNESLNLYQIESIDWEDEFVYVAAKNIRDALAKYKNFIVECVNADSESAPITPADVEDPISVLHLANQYNLVL